MPSCDLFRILFYIWTNSLNSISLCIHSCQPEKHFFSQIIILLILYSKLGSCFLLGFKSPIHKSDVATIPNRLQLPTIHHAILCLYSLSAWTSPRHFKDSVVRTHCTISTLFFDSRCSLLPFCTALHHHLHCTVMYQGTLLSVSLCVYQLS